MTLKKALDTLEEDIALVRKELFAAQNIVMQAFGSKATEESQEKYPPRQAFERIVNAIEGEEDETQ
jgi:hypothetical protein